MDLVQAFCVFGVAEPGDQEAIALMSTAATMLLEQLEKLSNVVVPNRHKDIREDVVQKTLLRLYVGERARELRSEKEVLGYLRAAVTNNFRSEISNRGLVPLDEHTGWPSGSIAANQEVSFGQQSAWRLLFGLCGDLASKKRIDLAANLRLCSDEWEKVLNGETSLDQLADREAIAEASQPEKRRAKNRFEQRHCRARKHVAAYIDHQVAIGELTPEDAESLRLCLEATKRRTGAGVE